MLLPPTHIPGFQWAAFQHPSSQSREGCGDLLAVLKVAPSRFAAAVGDVSGKGHDAASQVARLRSLLRDCVECDCRPAPVLERLNEIIHTTCRSTEFVTLFYCLADLELGRLTYASAGHEPTIALLSGGREQLLESTGTVLGAARGTRFAERSLALEEIDGLALYTDGVVEAHPPGRRDHLGQDRLLACLRESWQGTAEQIVDAVFRRVEAHGRGVWADDTSLLVLRRKACPREPTPDS